VSSITVFLLLMASSAPRIAFEGAEGFGATARGGTGGTLFIVNSLDDNSTSPAPGTFRWAVQQPGPRIIQFKVAGNLRLKDEISVKEPFLTVDGSTAPVGGVCICDHSFVCRNTHDIIIRHMRFRRGDVDVLQRSTAANLDRPKGSGDLDCVSLYDSKNIIFDHCSLSWSCDELICAVRCENVTIQWCLMGEPLANPRIHPYGDRHAFGLNLSANTLTMHHCLLAHYVMRGPQFEANDVRRGQKYDVRMEAINNVLFDYERTGSRYTAGIEDRPEEARGTTFEFQFVNNYYVPSDPKRPEILCTPKHGVIDRLKVFISGNIGPHRKSETDDELAVLFVEPRTPIASAPPELRSQVSSTPLFQPNTPVTLDTANAAYLKILDHVGAGPVRDAVDRRIIANVRSGRMTGPVVSQADVGGWPELVEP
jgi:hypothetical protein